MLRRLCLKEQHNILSLVIMGKSRLTGNTCTLSWLHIDNDGTYEVINCPWHQQRGMRSWILLRKKWLTMLTRLPWFSLSIKISEQRGWGNTDWTSKSSRTTCNVENISFVVHHDSTDEIGLLLPPSARTFHILFRRLVANKYQNVYKI